MRLRRRGLSRSRSTDCGIHIAHHLKSGVPVHVVAARAGHSKPSVTLNTYSHLLGGDDNLAANSADKTLKRVLGAKPVPKKA